MPKSSELAAKLLRDAAVFFDTISEQNPDLAAQMRENASVFRQVSDLVKEDPNREIGDEDEDALKQAEKAAHFVKRPDWIEEIWEPNAGDRIPFSDRNSWALCDPGEVAKLIERLIEPVEDQRLVALPDVVTLNAATFWKCQPTFYPGDALLVHVAGPRSDPKDAFFIDFVPFAGDGERQLRPLFRTAESIHRTNIEAPLLIDGSESDYMQFFMHLVGGDAGMFRVLQKGTLDHVRGVLSGLDNLSGVATQIALPRPVGVTVTGAIRYEVSIVYAGMIFNAVINVEPSGQVNMIDDEALCEAIDVLKEPLAKDAG